MVKQSKEHYRKMGSKGGKNRVKYRPDLNNFNDPEFARRAVNKRWEAYRAKQEAENATS